MTSNFVNHTFRCIIFIMIIQTQGLQRRLLAECRHWRRGWTQGARLLSLGKSVTYWCRYWLWYRDHFVICDHFPFCHKIVTEINKTGKVGCKYFSSPTALCFDNIFTSVSYLCVIRFSPEHILLVTACELHFSFSIQQMHLSKDGQLRPMWSGIHTGRFFTVPPYF